MVTSYLSRLTLVKTQQPQVPETVSSESKRNAMETLLVRGIQKGDEMWCDKQACVAPQSIGQLLQVSPIQLLMSYLRWEGLRDLKLNMIVLLKERFAILGFSY